MVKGMELADRTLGRSLRLEEGELGKTAVRMGEHRRGAAPRRKAKAAAAAAMVKGMELADRTLGRSLRLEEGELGKTAVRKQVDAFFSCEMHMGIILSCNPFFPNTTTQFLS